MSAAPVTQQPSSSAAERRTAATVDGYQRAPPPGGGNRVSVRPSARQPSSRTLVTCEVRLYAWSAPQPYLSDIKVDKHARPSTRPVPHPRREVTLVNVFVRGRVVRVLHVHPLQDERSTLHPYASNDSRGRREIRRRVEWAVAMDSADDGDIDVKRERGWGRRPVEVSSRCKRHPASRRV
jgi:hypothetical protein